MRETRFFFFGFVLIPPPPVNRRVLTKNLRAFFFFFFPACGLSALYSEIKNISAIDAYECRQSAIAVCALG